MPRSSISRWLSSKPTWRRRHSNKIGDLAWRRPFAGLLTNRCAGDAAELKSRLSAAEQATWDAQKIFPPVAALGGAFDLWWHGETAPFLGLAEKIPTGGYLAKFGADLHFSRK